MKTIIDIFPNYSEYTSSDVWKKIKKQQLEHTKDCECCWNKATVAHHLNYNIFPWQEELWRDIVSVCKECHYNCHWIDGIQIINKEKDLRARFDYLSGMYNESFYIQGDIDEGSYEPREAPDEDEDDWYSRCEWCGCSMKWYWYCCWTYCAEKG